MATQLSEDIDSLLEQYLQLLDEYAKLRTKLDVAQRTTYKNIARANFNTERGGRYGEGHYDGRMQASRLCRITVPAQHEGSPEDSTTVSTTATLSTFNPHEVGPSSDGPQQPEKDEGTKQESCKKEGGSKKKRKGKKKGKFMKEEPATQTGPPMNSGEGSSYITSSDAPDQMPNVHDPIRMFGILTPKGLRDAQCTSEHAVKDLIPAIANTNAQMKELEIQIKRARKHKLRATSNNHAEGTETQSQQSRTQGFIAAHWLEKDESLQQFLNNYLVNTLHNAMFENCPDRTQNAITFHTETFAARTRDLEAHWGYLVMHGLCRGPNPELELFTWYVAETRARVSAVLKQLPSGDHGSDLARIIVEALGYDMRLYRLAGRAKNATEGIVEKEIDEEALGAAIGADVSDGEVVDEHVVDERVIDKEVMVSEGLTHEEEFEKKMGVCCGLIRRPSRPFGRFNARYGTCA